ncbi:hypothetical protein EDB87DRAFT_1732891 [Lactarius vividus]|nr:hypothetical protein EDB87DRAFT_1732891 [Lactarius vividus]
MPSVSFKPILDAALADYTNQTGIDLATYSLADTLRSCASPDDVLKLLEDSANKFKDFLQVVHTLSAVLGTSIALVPFELAKAVFAGVDVFIAVASSVSSSYDALVDLFECLANFLKRIRIYNNLPLTPEMTKISVEIMTELLIVLALATKQIKQGRFKKFAKKLLGESEIESVLRRLDRLTHEEGRMTMTQTLEVVCGRVNNVKVMENHQWMTSGKLWVSIYYDESASQKLIMAADMMQQIANDINKIKRDRLQRESRSWLSPPDPSSNYNIACDIHQHGTATWFCEGSVFAEWNAKGSLCGPMESPVPGKLF